MLSVFCSPSRYTQGKNATASLGGEMLGLGLRGPALVVAGRSATKLLSSRGRRPSRRPGSSTPSTPSAASVPRPRSSG